MPDSAQCRAAAGILAWVLSVAVLSAQDRAVLVPVFGVVRDTSGKPVQDAEVRVVRFQIGGLPSYHLDQLDIPLVESNATRTDALGRFVLRLGDAGRFGVVATQGKEHRSAVVAPVAPAAQIELVLRRRVLIRGRVVDMLDGKACPGAAVQVRCYVPGQSAVATMPWPDACLGRLDTVQTDAEGGFTIRGLAGTLCWIECDGTRLDLEPAGEGAAGEPTVLTRDVFRVRGTVVDAATKNPIPDARLFAERGRFRADRKGLFDVLVPRTSTLDVVAPGFALLRQRVENSEPAVVALTRTPIVRMRLVDDNGKPCRQHELCVLQLASGPAGSGPVLTRRSTERDGTLRLPAGPKGFGFVVWARVADQWVRVCDAPPAERSVDLGDVSTATYDLHGMVVDASGLPVAHVPVFAAPVESAFGGRLPLAQHPLACTDHGGRFWIAGLPRRAFDVAARSSESLTTFGPVVRGPTNTSVRLQLQPAQRIRGRVVDDAGNPVAGATVFASAFRDADERLRRFGLWGNHARTDASGRFSVPVVVKDAEHQLSAQKVGASGGSQDVRAEPGAADVVLTLPRAR